MGMLLQVTGETVDLPVKKTYKEEVAMGLFVYFFKKGIRIN